MSAVTRTLLPAPLFPEFRDQPRYIVFGQAHRFNVLRVLRDDGIDAAHVEHRAGGLGDQIVRSLALARACSETAANRSSPSVMVS